MKTRSFISHILIPSMLGTFSVNSAEQLIITSDLMEKKASANATQFLELLKKRPQPTRVEALLVREKSNTSLPIVLKNSSCKHKSNQLLNFSNSFNRESQNSPYEFIVFVSLSMGKMGLKQLFKDVQKYNGKLILRGLYQNSFRQTQAKIKEYGINVEINPPLFQKYQINVVPTFVLSSYEGQFITEDRLQGNVTPGYVLEQFATSGDTKHIAQSLLNIGRPS